MGYYTRNASLVGRGQLSSNVSGVYDLNAIFVNPYSEFSPITFSNCGATGPIGPTLAQCQATYDANVESNLSVNYGYQSYTIPFSATYRFTLKGASGGVWITSPMSSTTSASSPTIDGYKRLPGATVVGEYALSANDVITMVIGQGGGDDNDSDANCPGAGGGTFVTLGTFSDIQSATDTLLFVAGGAAGSGYQSADNPTLNFSNGRGQSGTSGGRGNELGASSGNGSGSAQSSGNSSGGAGYLNGPGNNTTSNFTYTLSNANRVPAGFRQGATGGTWTGSSRGFGGFGGGGQGAATTGSDDDKGGGGGYSGGGYGFDAYETGGGGGSFIIGTASNTSATAGGNTTDRHGSVYLEAV